MLLQGVRVLDLSRLLPGAYCCRLLHEQGAEIIKIEPPSSEPLRLPGGEQVLQALQAGQPRDTLDLRTQGGRDGLLARVRAADVLVDGFRPGVMERLQLGYPTLAGANPGLVYCAITGYGSDGTTRARAGHDLNYLARSGALWLMPRSADGTPTIPGLQIADLSGGLQAAFLIAAALADRARSGRGCRVEVSLAGVMDGWTALPREARRAGLPGLGLTGEFPCYHVYAVADGFISVAALEPKFWDILCRTLGRDDLVERQFDPGAVAELQALFQGGSRADWMQRLGDADSCVEPVLDLEESETGQFRAF